MVPAEFATLPKTPGVYIFKDKAGHILYVGKAISLKDRVSSYFQGSLDLGPKTRALVAKIIFIEHVDVGSELEALLLEAELIKRHRPPYNISLKDDKSYQYIVIEKSEKFPRISTTHNKGNLNTNWLYFGPYPEGRTVRQVVKELRRIFMFRDCGASKYNRYQNLKRPCLFGDINLCAAPCVGRISDVDYNKNINRVVKFLSSGQKDPLIQEMKGEMSKLSENQEFEAASQLRDQISRFEYITQTFRPASEFLINPNLQSDQNNASVTDLLTVLGLSETSNQRLECVDISHLGGSQTVGSLVVFNGGRPDKTQYRRFRIKSVRGISDVDSISEVLTRRFKHEEWPLPRVLIIDGGKPQVAAAKKVLKDLNLTSKLELIGLAKQFETIVRSDGTSLRIPRNRPAIRLLQSLRDEAHRFANSYRKKITNL
ncbi:MAG: GIY-YIG nuclease family protein [candidate division WWE3 bacterium]|nr:GIY-YIG nuclease family protein [candidate division WWE3 bacterium]